MSVRPAKTQISLGIRPVWSESSLCAQWVAKDPSFLHADSEDSDQTWRIPRLIWVFAGRTVTLLVLSCRGSYTLWRNVSLFYSMKSAFLQTLAQLHLWLKMKLKQSFLFVWRCITLYPTDRLSVRPSVSASFPDSNLSSLWPILFKLCMGIDIREEWLEIANGLISFINNRVMAIDLC